jgi:aminoglycoside phosphotransferase (APT) family kinase protein
MKISNSDSYLALVLNSLEHVIVPELTSSGAKTTAEIIKQVLGELLHRESSAPQILANQLATGRLLADKMSDLCEASDRKGAAPDLDAERGTAAGFQKCVEDHSALTVRIAALADTLAARRSAALSPAQQQLISTLLREAACWEHGCSFVPRDEVVVNSPASTTRAPLNSKTLQAFLRGVHPDRDKCEVVDLTPIPGGFGKQTFRATIRNAAGTCSSLIVRKCDPMPMVETGCFLIEQEFALLSDLFANSKLPLAEPLYLGKHVSGVDADFFIMSALPGAVPSSFLGAASAKIPETILLQIAAQMAQLHQLKLDCLPNFLTRFGHPGVQAETVEATYRRQIGEWKTYFENGNHLASPFVIFMLDWLEQHVPANSSTPVLVHGDFNVHNVLVDQDRITGVLDWECAMIGAPEQDLAYAKPIMSQHIDWDRFLAHYRASGGPEIDEASMNFYMAFAAMRLCIIFNKGVANLQQGLTRDIRYAVVDLSLTPEFMTQALACTAE